MAERKKITKIFTCPKCKKCHRLIYKGKKVTDFKCGVCGYTKPKKQQYIFVARDKDCGIGVDFLPIKDFLDSIQYGKKFKIPILVDKAEVVE